MQSLRGAVSMVVDHQSLTEANRAYKHTPHGRIRFVRYGYAIRIASSRMRRASSFWPTASAMSIYANVGGPRSRQGATWI